MGNSALALTFLAVSQNLSLPPGLLEAICWVESNHKINAIHHDDGGSNSVGVCQVKLTTAKLMGYTGEEETLRNNAAINVFYSGKYLKHQLERYDADPAKAVSAYNAGRACLPANQAYVHKVFHTWGKGL